MISLYNPWGGSDNNLRKAENKVAEAKIELCAKQNLNIHRTSSCPLHFSLEIHPAKEGGILGRSAVASWLGPRVPIVGGT